MRLSEDEYAALWRTQIAESRQSTPPGWTPDRVETLTRLWNDGLNASVIAARLGGVTSRAVLVKKRRLGLAPRWTGHRRQKPAGNGSIQRQTIRALGLRYDMIRGSERS